MNKERDTVDETLRDGDVTQQNFRGVIVREIEEINSRLEGLARKDLLANISFFKEGILSCCTKCLKRTRVTSDYRATTAEAANGSANAETFSLAIEVKRLRLLA